MPLLQGHLSKMKVTLDSTVNYQLSLGQQFISLNPLIGQAIKIRFTGHIVCLNCQRIIKKSFNQGYCYPCFTTLAQCDLCIMKPETCHYEAGTCREPEWGQAFCFQPHYVYLANSSGIKVGITRENQIPTRWIDQGAIQALPIFKVQSRYLSGLIEVILARHISDKTYWQRMLKNQLEKIDLALQRDQLLAICQTDLIELQQRFPASTIELLTNQSSVDINFPVIQYPTKVKSFNLDKTAEVSGILQGIKGQYLLLDTGVINIRKFSGYEVEFSVL